MPDGFVRDFFDLSIGTRRQILPRVLVIRRKSGRMCGFGDGAVEDLFEGIYPLACGRVFGVHEMHVGRGWCMVGVVCVGA